MDLILQAWGGLFYLSNKALFAISEGKEELFRKNLKMLGWIVYILGVPAWVIILMMHNDWIAASIEAGGVPAMFLGLYNAYHDNDKKNRLFEKIVEICTYTSLAFGLFYSLNVHSGISSISQGLEIGVMLGFLLGSYFLAKNNPTGWLFFMLMNISMATLMLLQNKYILMVQQVISLCFVIYGLSKTRNKKESIQSL